MMEEIWKILDRNNLDKRFFTDIYEKDKRDYPGEYYVSTYGRVKHIYTDSNGKTKEKPCKIILPDYFGGGEPRVKINGVSQAISYLVACTFPELIDKEHFVYECNSYKSVHISHKDKNILNNHANNLYFGYRGYYDEGPKCNNMVLCVETNIGYKSFEHAEKETGIDARLIELATIDKTYITGGFHWKLLYKISKYRQLK